MLVSVELRLFLRERGTRPRSQCLAHLKRDRATEFTQNVGSGTQTYLHQREPVRRTPGAPQQEAHHGDAEGRVASGLLLARYGSRD